MASGKGLKVRTRLYMVSPQQQTNVDCKVQLMEKALCQGSRTECTFNTEDARYICSLEKETGPCRHVQTLDQNSKVVPGIGQGWRNFKNVRTLLTTAI